MTIDGISAMSTAELYSLAASTLHRIYWLWELRLDSKMAEELYYAVVNLIAIREGGMH